MAASTLIETEQRNEHIVNFLVDLQDFIDILDINSQELQRKIEQCRSPLSSHDTNVEDFTHNIVAQLQNLAILIKQQFYQPLERSEIFLFVELQGISQLKKFFSSLQTEKQDLEKIAADFDQNKHYLFEIERAINLICSEFFNKQLSEFKKKNLCDKLRYIMPLLLKRPLMDKKYFIDSYLQQLEKEIQTLVSQIQNVATQDTNNLKKFLFIWLGGDELQEIQAKITKFSKLFLETTDARPSIANLKEFLALCDQFAHLTEMANHNYESIASMKDQDKLFKFLHLSEKPISDLSKIASALEQEITTFKKSITDAKISFEDLHAWVSYKLNEIAKLKQQLDSLPDLSPSDLRSQYYNSERTALESMFTTLLLEVFQKLIAKSKVQPQGEEFIGLAAGIIEAKKRPDCSATVAETFYQALLQYFINFKNAHDNNVLLFETFNKYFPGCREKLSETLFCKIHIAVMQHLYRYEGDILSSKMLDKILPLSSNAASLETTLYDLVVKQRPYLTESREIVIAFADMGEWEIKDYPTFHQFALATKIGSLEQELRKCSAQIIYSFFQLLTANLQYPIGSDVQIQLHIKQNPEGNSIDIVIHYTNIKINADGFYDLGTAEIIFNKKIDSEPQLVCIKTDNPLLLSALVQKTFINHAAIEYLQSIRPVGVIKSTNVSIRSHEDNLQKAENLYSRQREKLPPFFQTFLFDFFQVFKTKEKKPQQMIDEIFMVFNEKFLLQINILVRQLQKISKGNFFIKLDIINACENFDSLLPFEKFAKLLEQLTSLAETSKTVVAPILDQKIASINSALEVLCFQFYKIPVEALEASYLFLNGELTALEGITYNDYLSIPQMVSVNDTVITIEWLNKNKEHIAKVCYSLVFNLSQTSWEEFHSLLSSVKASQFLYQLILACLKSYIKNETKLDFFINTLQLLQASTHLRKKITKILSVEELLEGIITILCCIPVKSSEWLNFLSLFISKKPLFSIDTLHHCLSKITSQQMAVFVFNMPNNSSFQSTGATFKLDTCISSLLVNTHKVDQYFIAEVLRELLALKYHDIPDDQIVTTFLREDDAFPELAKNYMIAGFAEGQKTLDDYIQSFLPVLQTVNMEVYEDKVSSRNVCYRLSGITPETKSDVEAKAQETYGRFIKDWFTIIFANKNIVHYFYLLRNYLIQKKVDLYEASVKAFQAITNRITQTLNDRKIGLDSTSQEFITIKVFGQVLQEFGLPILAKGTMLPEPIKKLISDRSYVLGLFADFNLDAPPPEMLQQPKPSWSPIMYPAPTNPMIEDQSKKQAEQTEESGVLPLQYGGLP